ncbi:collagen alpha-1(XV) chain-like [Stylophora pistillata]|uniref:collagen alpha-1(XV) chain-like n=1 Tax=Stylophora pistillata TaxID=50429 RepID=UPI000C038F5B|nr:collagen alpha-1(XV) chain-like [Stylophora pistillata]
MRPGVQQDGSFTRLVSLAISSCVWCCTVLLNDQPLVQARHLGRFKRYPVNSLKDVDLLGTIGNPLPIGVSLTRGPYTKPAFHFRSGANVGRFARFIFPKGFLKEFSISTVIRPRSSDRGVVFALLPHIRRGNVILGLEIHRDSFSEGTTISLIHANNGNTRTVFEFTVPDLTGRWTWLSFSIKNNGVTFFKDCREVDTSFVRATLGVLTFPRYSALYIGRAGWTPGASSSAFQGDIAELSMHSDPNKAQHQECKADTDNNRTSGVLYNSSRAFTSTSTSTILEVQ